MFSPSTVSKAIAGGIVGLIIAEAARFGFQPNAAAASALSVLVTALVGYVVGHLVVYFAPANKTKIGV